MRSPRAATSDRRGAPRQRVLGGALSSPISIGTVNGDSVRRRLRLAGSARGTHLNGQLDGEALKLVVAPGNASGPETVRLDPALRKDSNAAVARLRAGDAARSHKATTAPLRADAKDKAEMTRVATAYDKALDPGSANHPCGYLSAAARADVSDDAPPEAPAGGWTTLIRFHRQGVAAHPKRPGTTEIDLRTLDTVPGGSGGNLADGAELRFAGMPKDPIGLVQEDGQWRIAEHR